MAHFFAGHDRPRGTEALDRMMIAAHNVSENGFEAPANGWMLDSGGFTQLTTRGEYERTPADYVRFVMDASEKIPGLVAAVQQDYIVCDEVAEATGRTPGRDADFALRAETGGRFLRTHRAARRLGCDVPIMPVLQGRTQAEYVEEASNLRHLEGEVSIVGLGGLKARKKDSPGETPSPAWCRELVLRLDEVLDVRWHALGIGARYMNHPEAGPVLRRRLWSYDSAAWKVQAYYNDDADHNDTAFATEYADGLTRSAPLFE